MDQLASSPDVHSVGTKFRVTRTGSKASLVNIETKATYTLDIGADGNVFLEEFVTRRPVGIEQFPEDVPANIRNAVTKVGMTKERLSCG